MQQEKIRTIHVYFEEEEDLSIVDAGPEPARLASRLSRLPLLYLVLVTLWGVGVPVLAVLCGLAYPAMYIATRAQTITLTLSLHPTKEQLPLDALPTISVRQQVTVAATGSQHQVTTKATGLITFYNGAFTAQTVLAGTTFKGKDGIAVVTSHDAVIPPAAPTTPPTYGTVSVTAVSSVSGELGNIAASDIDQACCAPSILAQNLDAFSGGQDARDIPVLTQSDVSTGSQALTTQAEEAVNSQVQQETRPGMILLPLGCTDTLVASHQAGDQVAASTLTLTKICIPFAYAAADIVTFAQRHIHIPQGYHLVSFSAFVAESHTTATGGALTVEAIAYLKRDTPVVKPYRFAGK